MRSDLRLGEIFLEGRERDGGRVVNALRVDALFIARRSVGAQLEALRGAAYAERAEVRDFEDELVRILEYRVELAAHDSREADGRFLVGYDEVLGGERQRLAVEKHELLALVGAAHVNAARDVLAVEAVRRLPSREHYVVRDVDGKVYRALPDAPEHALEREGRRDVLYSLDYVARVARAARVVLYLDLELLAHFGELDGLDGLQRAFVNRRELARHAVVSPEVGAVRHRLVVYFEDYVVQVERVGERRAGGGSELRDVHYLGGLRRREEVREADFARGADHSVAHDAAQLRGLYLDGVALAVPFDPRAGLRDGDELLRREVDSSADYHRRLGVADVYGADAQLVRVGMFVDSQNLSDDEAGEALADVRRVLDLDGAHREVVGELVHREVSGKVDVAFYPV